MFKTKNIEINRGEGKNMPTIAIPCPNSVLISLKETPEKFAREATT
jgi:hypothetical protein